MIKIPTFIVKDASRVYGDMAEKVAFDVNIDPASVLGAIGGGYVATRVHDNIKDKEQTEIASQRTLEGDFYSQIETILANLKIVFTPINVVYSVNGQVFEIVDANEMTPHMRTAFLQKDAHYFRDILVNKMNMELQLAEQAFAKRLLSGNQQLKEASFVAKQDYLTKLAEDQFELLKEASVKGLDEAGQLSIPLNFDGLRPFSRASEFFNQKEFQKVAGVFDYFKRDAANELSLDQIEDQVKVGFLPDRVIFLHNGQLIEQISLLNMSDEGYEAYRNRNADFFLDFFQNKSAEIAESIQAQAAQETQPEKTASEEEVGLEKGADSLEEVVENTELAPFKKENLNIFRDSDVHPVVYAKVLSGKYGERWTRHELEAVLKQIEVDYKLQDGIADIPLNKISALYATASEDHSMFLTSFSFEKYMRAMNSKDILFEEFQGNLSFEEILFGLEVVKAFNGDDVTLEFHHTIAEYVSEELFRDGIRFVSDQLFDETNPYEKDFFDSVNGFLMRKWKEKDTTSMDKQEEIEEQKRVTEAIVSIGAMILARHVDEIDFTRMYSSTEEVITKYKFLSYVYGGVKDTVKNLVTDNVVRHVGAAFYLEGKRQELQETLALVEKKGVK